jgi:predicted DNA-binding mobile mystery protein A
MNIKSLVLKQYREIIAAATQKIVKLKVPPEGWLRTNRKALQMPAKIIMKKAGIKSSELYRIEKAEIDGTLTLNKLKNMANAMDCDFHYAIIPRGEIKTLIENKARRHAVKLLENANVHMQLESQGTSAQQIELQIDQVAEQLIKEMPDWFWGDTSDNE